MIALEKLIQETQDKRDRNLERAMREHDERNTVALEHLKVANDYRKKASHLALTRTQVVDTILEYTFDPTTYSLEHVDTGTTSHFRQDDGSTRITAVDINLDLPLLTQEIIIEAINTGEIPLRNVDLGDQSLAYQQHIYTLPTTETAIGVLRTFNITYATVSGYINNRSITMINPDRIADGFRGTDLYDFI